jgi:predicted phage terminase large subunit-like protein
MSQHASRIKKLETHRTSNATSETKIPRDPVAFATLLDIKPDPWQRDLLTATDEYIILNCSRQSGKSTIVAILALHHALLNPGALVAILSPSQRQSTELLRKIRRYNRLLGQPGGRVTDSATSLELRNGSRVVALPGSESTTRGFTASLLLIDEAAQVSEDDYYAATPMLAATQGRLIILSTPHGKQGIFWHAWDQGPDWKRVKVTADECPRISKDFLDRERCLMGEQRFAQEYCCEFVQGEGSLFKEEWIQYFDPHTVPNMDMIIQSWDTAVTKSTTSDFVVGQVWGRRGADFYLLEQVRDRWDFDETVSAMKEVTRVWPESSSVIVEAQTLGAALASHLKKQISGIIPIHVKQSKELRAMSCVPAWQSKNVYIPLPDSKKWVRDYVRELLNFPNATNDDQVDATTLALNQLRGALFPNMRAAAKPIKEKGPIRGHEYVMGWIPARLDHEYTLIVYDLKDNEVVRFLKPLASPIDLQLRQIYDFSVAFNGAICRVIEGYDDALTYGAELKGVYIEKIKFNRASIAAAYENLSQLIRNKLIDVPEYPELMAELNVFRSEDTFDETPDYTTQIAQQSAIDALALCTYDLDPTMWEYKPDIWAPFEFYTV